MLRAAILFFVLALSVTSVHSFAIAEETMGEKVSEVGRDMKKSAKKTGRAIKDKTCEIVNGKMECAGKKMKHKLENGMDEVKDKADDVTH